MNALRLVVLLAVASCAGTPVVADRALHSARGTLVARLVAEPLDPARHAATCKPWHQLFAPDGRQLTKDLGGEYEHHRGLFVGWNQVRCGDTRFDFRHCRQGE
ncbi:MAG: PmoA family protein, partial [Planctomycetes bacterium]|nr:PmoA family protein [Planctomycetota bacterium]